MKRNLWFGPVLLAMTLVGVWAGPQAVAEDLSAVVFTSDGSWVVPDGVGSVTIDALGAQGGDGLEQGAGGLGGRARATVPVAPGDTLHVFVGGAGEDGAAFESGHGGANGGGDSLEGNLSGGGGGGGASDVRLNGTNLADRVVVAGGGGGASSVSDGGAGGGLAGLAGDSAFYPSGGGGGTQTAGGVGGFGEYGPDSGGAYTGQPGAFGKGGTGFFLETSGGGGGGGWYGGGGGGAGDCCADAGGGGSGYARPGATGVTLKAGVRAGDGQVTITPIEAPPAPAPDFEPVVFTADGSWIVPEGARSVVIEALGAEGGTGTWGSAPGGLGGRVQASLAVTPGETLHVFVGGAGGDGLAETPGAGGDNGGGDAGPKPPTGFDFLPGAGGGGASDVRMNGVGLTNRVVVAGGGGGGGSFGGGAGGGLNGAPGVDSRYWPNGEGGGGGTQDAGGAAGATEATWYTTPASAGVFGIGGTGSSMVDGGGGGGGGWYGGGGGGGTGAGGGGGSGFASPAAVDVTLNTGVRAGDGQVTLTASTRVIDQQPSESPAEVEPQNVKSGDLADSGVSDTGNLVWFGLLLVTAGTAALIGGRRLNSR